MAGNPARQVGWMSRHGQRLAAPDEDGIWLCPESGLHYKEVPSGVLRCLDLDEEAHLSHEQSATSKSYDEFKTISPMQEALK
jgi:UDP-2-acetamido-3-amino-2,3-dideoxy-glucuronate N-acetyltransferase